jgi:hypothetical protein
VQTRNTTDVASCELFIVVMRICEIIEKECVWHHTQQGWTSRSYRSKTEEKDIKKLLWLVVAAPHPAHSMD